MLVVTSPVEFLQYVTVKVTRRSAQITWYKIILYIHVAPTVTYRCSCCGLSLSLSKERQLSFVMLEAWRMRTLYSVHLPVFNQQMNVISWREEKKNIITKYKIQIHPYILYTFITFRENLNNSFFKKYIYM